MNLKICVKLIMYFSFYMFLSGNSIYAAGPSEKLYDIKFSFEGIFGKFDIPSARRGLQLYREVCAGCHGLKYVAYRNLSSLGFSDEEIKTIASEYETKDGPNDEGEMYYRSALPSDKFVDPYENEKAAKAMNNGGAPPDLSLIVKARANGSKYLYSLLVGYEDAPEDFDIAN